MTTLYLVRHAEAEGNLYRRAHGHYDSTITARGYRQIAALAGRFVNKPIDAVYSSDLTRTQTTALSIVRTHGLPLHTMSALREVGVGEWEDKTWAWLTKFDCPRLVRFNTDSGSWRVRDGETIAMVRARMLCAINDIISAHPDQTVAIFSHGLALRLLIGTLQGLSIAEIDKTPHGENTAVSKLVADETGIHVVYRDDASHLPDALATLRNQAWVSDKAGLETGVWFSPDTRVPGRFEVMCDDTFVGVVSVHRENVSTAVIDEFWLDSGAQKQGYGVCLVGQAVSLARALGCTFLEITLARDEPDELRQAARYGFLPVRATAEAMTYQLYIGYDKGYRVVRFDKEWAALRRQQQA